MAPILWRHRVASVLGGHSICFQFSGMGYTHGTRAPACWNFLLFTLPLVPGVSHSAGASLSPLANPETKSATEHFRETNPHE
jgi:hypothetical protein